MAFYPHTFNAAYRGTQGPIQVSVPHHIHTVDRLIQESLANKGLKKIPDAYGGDVSFSFLASPCALDRHSK